MIKYIFNIHNSKSSIQIIIVVGNVDVGMVWVAAMAVDKVDVGMRDVEMSGMETLSVELLDMTYKRMFICLLTRRSDNKI